MECGKWLRHEGENPQYYQQALSLMSGFNELAIGLSVARLQDTAKFIVQ